MADGRLILLLTLSHSIAARSFKTMSFSELGSHIWQFPPEQLAKILSAKKRKSSAPLHTAKSIDCLEYYNCAIDRLEPALENVTRQFIEHIIPVADGYKPMPSSTFIDLLNKAMVVCSAEHSGGLHESFRFCHLDKRMRDDGTSAVKPAETTTNKIKYRCNKKKLQDNVQ
ncbi:hypothetical protein BDP27DRAFT_1493773 [Rhodocollybia butyracea]|uniref:Uncharacterized protein n=1 Tax=Rhodocollybia butyracea TaxID=206335 RepID=A0A9P5PZX8_9AGAR|nr:hypothetical protein BDP27DRAFT_1493773 [Rhodocollybia butyracea]